MPKSVVASVSGGRPIPAILLSPSRHSSPPLDPGRAPWAGTVAEEWGGPPPGADGQSPRPSAHVAGHTGLLPSPAAVLARAAPRTRAECSLAECSLTQDLSAAAAPPARSAAPNDVSRSRRAAILAAHAAGGRSRGAVPDVS
ncbi:hypothetical protein PtB15_14B289 [Puccinia triticina]|nr:hypothetical protein PtB15_14B289 [Puccinia triticina]